MYQLDHVEEGMYDRLEESMYDRLEEGMTDGIAILRGLRNARWFGTEMQRFFFLFCSGMQAVLCITTGRVRVVNAEQGGVLRWKYPVENFPGKPNPFCTMILEMYLVGSCLCTALAAQQ